MPNAHALRAALLALPLSLVTLSVAWASTWTCEGVTRRYLSDPSGLVFSGSFRDDVSVNSSGDVLFSARPAGARDRLYLYDAAGVGEIVASGGDASPGGDTFGSSRTFSSISINDAGDVGFFARLDRSRGGVFIRTAGGALESAALAGQAAPGGGSFGSFPEASAVDPTGRIVFIATVNGGDDGIFLYDPSSDTLTRELSVGDLAADGTSAICGLYGLALGSTNTAIAFRGSVNSTGVCGLGDLDAILVRSQPTSAPAVLALVGGSAPGGSTFAAISGSSKFHRKRFSPAIDPSQDVTFVAELDAGRKSAALLRWDAATDTLAVLANQGTELPGSTFRMRSFQSPQVDDGSQIFARVRSKSRGSPYSVTNFGSTPGTALKQGDAPPTNAAGFYPGAQYRKFGSLVALSRDGTKFVLAVKVRDTVHPRGKTGIVRCSSN